MANISIEDAIRIAADGEAILFVGAGIGFLTEGKLGPLPSGPVLSNRILGQPDSKHPAQPLDKASGYALRNLGGVEPLYTILQQNLTVEKIDPRLQDLYAMPWRRIYTTNYDSAIELSRKGKQPTNSCTLEDGIAKAKTGTIVHLNGMLDRISAASIEKQLSLTDRSYVDRNLERSPWHGFLARDLETARAIIFIGYSLYDLDISRLVFETNISEKAFFFVSPNVDAIEEDNIRQFGQTPGGGIDALFGVKEAALIDYSPTPTRAGFTNLRRIGPDSSAAHFEAARLIDAQLIFGLLPEAQTISGETAFNNQQFVVQRRQQKEALEQIWSGRYRDLLVVGEFVSGKSSTALSMVGEFIRNGYLAYLATHGPGLSADLERLATYDDRIVVVFEGYTTFRRTILEYAAIRNAKHRMVLTEQSVQHELHSEFLFSPAIVDQVFELTLDKIADDDCVEFASLINFGGFWGERAGASDASNARHIARRWFSLSASDRDYRVR